MRVPFLAWLLQTIPESISAAAVVMSMGYARPYWRATIVVGLIHGIFVYVIRMLPITFGVHTVLLIIILALVSSWVGKIDIRKAVIYANLTVLMLALYEFCFISIWRYFGNYDLSEIMGNVTLRIVTGTPQVIALFLTALLIGKFVKENRKARNN